MTLLIALIPNLTYNNRTEQDKSNSQGGKMPEDASPTGTVTLLFTDIEGSTQLLRRLGNGYADMLTMYRNFLRTVFQQWSGYEAGMQGDAFFFVFARATDAVAAAVAAQRGLVAHAWPEGVEVRIRMGLHTGEPVRSSKGYVGLDVHLAAQIMSIAHGGQILLSETTSELTEYGLPDSVSLKKLGFYHLKDVPCPKRIFQLVIAGLPADFPPLRNAFKQFNNLPAQITPLIGRGQEVTATATLLQRENIRLLTLTGTGGIGKTRLGLAVANELLDIFADGVCFVPLAPISDPALVIPTIAHLLGLEQNQAGKQSTTAHIEYLKAFLQDKHFLLVLDNFEQVVLAALDLLELLRGCPHLKMLVTSRAVLHIQGEYEFLVPPLALPERNHLPDSEEIIQYAAVALFVQHALEVKPDFALTKVNAHAVAAICMHLEGLPLAIELAAARIKLLPPQALLQRMTHRLTVLTSGTRDAPARQQTLRNTIAWSYNLLNVMEQRLFQRLSVFAGSFTLEAAEFLCAACNDGTEEVLTGVESLIDKSLLQQARQECDEPRFVMLETLREYSLEALAASGEEEITRLAHANYYLQIAERAEKYENEYWFSRLEQEHDNMRAAVIWLVEQDEGEQYLEIALRLTGALRGFLAVRGDTRQWQQWLDRALTRSEHVNASVRAKALNCAGWLAFWQSDYEQAEVRYTESLQLYRTLGDPEGTALGLYNLGLEASSRGNFTVAASLLEESIVLFRQVNDKGRLAFSLLILGLTSLGSTGLTQYTRVRPLFEESQTLFQETSNEEGIAWSLFCSGVLKFQQGDALTANALFEQSLEMFKALRYRHYFGHPLYFLGKVAASQGNIPAAYSFFQECLTVFKNMGDNRSVAACLEEWGRLVAKQGVPVLAVQLWGMAERLRETSGLFDHFTLLTIPVERSDYERLKDMVRAQLGESAYSAALAEGQAMTLEHIVRKLLEETVHTSVVSTGHTSPPALPTSTTTVELTAREVEVLHFVAQGLTNFEIAEILGLSEKTIAYYMTRIYNKTATENRAAATAFAIRQGLV